MKRLLVILGILVALAAVALVIVAFSLGSIVHRGVNEIGPRLTQTPVTLGEATLSPLSGKGTLTNLRVGNPEGWSEQDAFSLGEIRLDVDPMTLLQNPIVIEELVIDRPQFRYEQKLTGGSNIKDLMDNIQEAMGGPAEKPIGEPEEPPRKFIIKQLRLREGSVDVSAQVAAATVPLPELAYDNLGVNEGGLTGGEIANVVLRDVLGRVLSVATTKGLMSLPSNATGKTLQSVGQGLQQLLGGKKAEEPKKQPEPEAPPSGE